MKKAILIFCCVLSCAISGAQDGDLADAAKTKAQAVPISARIPDHEAKKVVVFPNPSNGIVHVTLAGFKGKRTEVRIMNVIGNVVYREILTETDDRYTKIIDLTKNASGLYYVKLEADGFSEIRKIIINQDYH
jgi:hypothetical protein